MSAPAPTPEPICEVNQGVTRDYIRTVYARPEVTKKARDRIKYLIGCANEWERKPLRRSLKRVRQERNERIAAEKVTPYQCGGDRYAIPCYIVSCESSLTNARPNYATASGYYQFITSTWLSTGGGRYAPQAYLASKHEQDIIAARLWSGGSGAGHWDCA